MKLNKILNNLYYLILLLVPAGWVLNWKYYYSRFDSEGFEPWLCIIIPIILVIFATVSFTAGNYFKKKKDFLHVRVLCFVIYSVLAFYSVNCTTAGQYWDQRVKDDETEIQTNTEKNIEYFIDEQKQIVVEQKEELKRLNSINENSIENLGDMYYYKNTGKTLQELKKEAEEKRDAALSEIKRLSQENNVSINKKDDTTEKSKTLYQFYTNIFLGKNGDPQRIQFIFQVILSVIIELIAQVSIYIFMSIQGMSKTVSEPKINITTEDIKYFSIFAWRAIKTKAGNYLLLGEDTLKQIINTNKSYNIDKHKFIIQTALKNNLIRKDNKQYVQYNNFTTDDYFYNRMHEIFRIKSLI